MVSLINIVLDVGFPSLDFLPKMQCKSKVLSFERYIIFMGPTGLIPNWV
jgi:hypothetical protein